MAMAFASRANDFLQLLAPTVELVVFIGMLARGLWRRFPGFAFYLAFYLLRVPTIFAISHRHASTANYFLYFQVYWISEGISACLTFAVIYELYMHVFRSYASLERPGRRALNWLGGMLLLAGVFSAALSTGNDFSRLVKGIHLVQQTFDIMRFGLMLFLFLFASYLRIRWTSYSWGIAIGVAFYASCDLAVQAIQLHYGRSADMASALMLGAAYDCAAIIWLTYLLKRSSRSEQSFELPTNDLAVWNDALAGMLNR